jgi:hypothetical protein
MYFYPDNIHESILIFQKGKFDYNVDEETKENSKINLAEYQKNKWYLSVWDVTNVLPLKGRLEEGIAAFPEELIRRLITLFSFKGETVLAGGTQMLAVAAVLRELGKKVPSVVTTVYVRDDPSAGFTTTADRIGTRVYYVDPDFATIGHKGLARYCVGEVKEGIGAGGAMFLARMMGKSEEEIRDALLITVSGY